MPRKICVWPCGTWCELDAIEEYSWMSDDFRTVLIGQHTTDETIEAIVYFLNQ